MTVYSFLFVQEVSHMSVYEPSPGERKCLSCDHYKKDPNYLCLKTKNYTPVHICPTSKDYMAYRQRYIDYQDQPSKRRRTEMPDLLTETIESGQILHSPTIASGHFYPSPSQTPPTLVHTIPNYSLTPTTGRTFTNGFIPSFDLTSPAKRSPLAQQSPSTCRRDNAISSYLLTRKVGGGHPVDPDEVVGSRVKTYG